MFTEEFDHVVKSNNIYLFDDGALKLVLRIVHRHLIFYGISDVFCVDVTWTPFCNKFKLGFNYEKIDMQDFEVGIVKQVKFLKYNSVGVE